MAGAHLKAFPFRTNLAQSPFIRFARVVMVIPALDSRRTSSDLQANASLRSLPSQNETVYPPDHETKQATDTLVTQPMCP
jgi:hypothetical protein